MNDALSVLCLNRNTQLHPTLKRPNLPASDIGANNRSRDHAEIGCECAAETLPFMRGCAWLEITAQRSEPRPEEC